LLWILIEANSLNGNSHTVTSPILELVIMNVWDIQGYGWKGDSFIYIGVSYSEGIKSGVLAPLPLDYLSMGLFCSFLSLTIALDLFEIIFKCCSCFSCFFNTLSSSLIKQYIWRKNFVGNLLYWLMEVSYYRYLIYRSLLTLLFLRF
jgi:hypothetical protein